MSTWEVKLSKSRNQAYFHNPATSQSVWEPPAELTEEQIRALPGAHLLQAPPPPPTAKAGEVQASHILRKHVGSRRPSSWRQAKITRSRDTARQEIQSYIDHLRSIPPQDLKAAFAQIASTESDCSSGREKQGDLGVFRRGQMQKAFEDATYALQPGEMSGIVETESGVHVILRTG